MTLGNSADMVDACDEEREVKIEVMVLWLEASKPRGGCRRLSTSSEVREDVLSVYILNISC